MNSAASTIPRYTPPDSVTTSKDRKDIIHSWLGRTLRVTINDGRVFIGTFKCLDCFHNIILDNCIEFQKVAQDREENKFIGLAMLPGKSIASVWIETPPSPSPPV